LFNTKTIKNVLISWQEGSYPEQLANADMVWQKLAYAHGNPLRRGYVDEAIGCCYSSARDYAARPGLLDVVTDWA
jgi:hypothetical protein